MVSGGLWALIGQAAANAHGPWWNFWRRDFCGGGTDIPWVPGLSTSAAPTTHTQIIPHSLSAVNTRYAGSRGGSEYVAS